MPEVTIPVFSLLPHIWVDIVVITMVSYTITISMALIFARKLMYEVDSNQELLALVKSHHFFLMVHITHLFKFSGSQ